MKILVCLRKHQGIGGKRYLSYRFYMPARVLYGAGSLNKLAKMRLPGKKALLVTGGASTTRLGYVDRVCTLLQQGGAECVVYRQVQPNPTIENVRQCAALCRAQGCDFVVGLGGGSSIDTAKAAAVMAVNDGDLWDYVHGGSGKGMKIPNPPLPIVAITTTAGTGTEADPWTVITNGEEKIGFGFDGTYPTLSVVDAELMLSVPPHLTAYQGFDALFHATEGYIAAIASPVSDMFALQSISLIAANLARAVKNGQDLEARENLALANTLSGFVESTSGCTSEHSIEHALSAVHPDLPHGAGLIMISLAYYKRFTQACSERMIKMAQAMGKTNADKPQDFIDALAQLQRDCGVDTLRMQDFGIDRAQAEKYAAIAFDTMGGNFKLDRHTLTPQDVADIITESWT